jgi:hypothetical protein
LEEGHAQAILGPSAGGFGGIPSGRSQHRAVPPVQPVKEGRMSRLKDEMAHRSVEIVLAFLALFFIITTAMIVIGSRMH